MIILKTFIQIKLISVLRIPMFLPLTQIWRIPDVFDPICFLCSSQLVEEQNRKDSIKQQTTNGQKALCSYGDKSVQSALCS